MLPLLLIVVTAVLWGIAPIFDKIGMTTVDPLVGVTIRSIIVTGGLLLLTFALNKGNALIHVSGQEILVLGASGLTAGILGMWTYYTALSLGPTSKIVPIGAAYPLVTALLSVIVLKEDLTLSRVMGTALIIIGIWLVK